MEISVYGDAEDELREQTTGARRKAAFLYDSLWRHSQNNTTS